MKKYSSVQVAPQLFKMNYENNFCVECQSQMPDYVSINNSIFLCSKCARIHETLGYNISYIRKISQDWDQYLFSYLERGGNSRFINFSKKYNLDYIPIEQKYRTRIMEYYRLLVSNLIYNNLQIKSEVLADLPPEIVPEQFAKDPIVNEIIYFPEFQNYQIYVGNFNLQKKILI